MQITNHWIILVANVWPKRWNGGSRLICIINYSVGSTFTWLPLEIIQNANSAAEKTLEDFQFGKRLKDTFYLSVFPLTFHKLETFSLKCWDNCFKCVACLTQLNAISRRALFNKYTNRKSDFNFNFNFNISIYVY